MLRILFAVFLILHGIAHQVGFLAAWQLWEFKEAPLHTILLAGRIDVGLAGIRVIGILWLLTGLAFLACAVGVWRDLAWWPALTTGVVLVSLVMSVLGWPDARIGVGVNLVILMGLWISGRLPVA